ncbi:hypothetical protein [Streptomyces sp. NPDC058255]|uniref:hypothetical protein n=1 Tax=Streptomyces sp. NPDC058255 TaxID=3346407 RepID=UPI0036EA336E
MRHRTAARQDRGPALLVREGREPPVDLVPGRRTRRLEPLVVLPRLPTRLSALPFQKADKRAHTADGSATHIVERVVPTGCGHQGVVEHGRDDGRPD